MIDSFFENKPGQWQRTLLDGFIVVLLVLRSYAVGILFYSQRCLQMGW
jgi:hypothetical protein